MATTTKLNVDKATVRQLFKAVTKATAEINEKSILFGQAKRVLPLQYLAQASEFYVPNGNRDRIQLTSNGHPDIRAWTERELVNTKAGWESLGIVSSSLISGETMDINGFYHPIPQTMAGVEVDIESDEFQAWFAGFTKYPPQAVFEGQNKINEILSKYFEEPNRSNRSCKSHYYATERFRDIKVVLMNKLYKIKSSLRSKLLEELCKPIVDHKSFVEARENIELLISMVEMAYGLPYKDEDHTTAIQFIDAQLERINSQTVFAHEHERLEMIRILHAARVEAGNGKDLDIEILLNQVGGIFKPEEETPDNEDSLQAALSANVQRQSFANRGAAVQDRRGPKKNPDEKPPKHPASEIARLVQAVFDMKSEMGCMRRALMNAGISIEKSPIVQKQKEHFINGKKKSFAGTAKKNKFAKVNQRSLVPVRNRDAVSDSDDDDDQPDHGQYVGMARVMKPRKHVSPRLVNAMMVGMTRRNSESRRISECDEHYGQAWYNDEVENQLMQEESWQQQDLFGRPDAVENQQLRDVMSQQEEARDQEVGETNVDLGSYSDDDATEDDDKQCEAIESECSIIDETVRPSPKKAQTSPRKIRTRSKAWGTYMIPDSIICSDVEDEEPRTRSRKRNVGIKTPLRAGATAKYLRRNSAQFPSMASKTLAVRKTRAGKKGSK